MSSPECDFTASKPQQKDYNPPTRLPAIVNTADRVDFCCRCVASLCDSDDINAVLEYLLVIDGSRDAASSIELRRKLSHITKKLAGPVIHFGSEERARVLDWLAAEGFDQRTLSFTIGESQDVFSAGAARNLGLLLTAGKHVLTIDDAVWKFYVLNGSRTPSALTLCGETRNWSIHFFATREAALQAHSPLAMNAVLAAQRLLGKSPSQIAACWPGSVDDVCACRRMEMDILERSGCVAAIQVGIVGDSGWHSADLLSAYDVRLAQRFDTVPSILRTSLFSREVSAYCDTYSIGHDSKCMAIGLFLDNKLPLPPFMPQHRNEDGVFGSIVHACLPHAYSAHLPFAMLHDAPQRNGYQRVESVRACDLVMRLIADAAGGPSGLETLGLYFAQSAMACDNGWETFVRTMTARIRSERIEAISIPLQRLRSGSPVRQQLQRCRKRIITDLAANPSVISEFGPDTLRARQFIGLFGQMCRAWPALREYALQNTERLLKLGTRCGGD